MVSQKFRKIISTALIFSTLIGFTASLNNKDVKAMIEINPYEYDIYKGTISISKVITYMGMRAVSIEIPKDLMISEVTLKNNPHDHMNTAILGNKIIIYGLNQNFTYTNLVIIIKDIMQLEHKYIINPFKIVASPSIGLPGEVIIVTPSTSQLIFEYLNKLYSNLFGRRFDYHGITYWTNQLDGRFISLRNFFKNLLSEKEFLKSNPTTKDKIRKLYLGIFEREPDDQGFNFWVNEYNSKLKKSLDEKEALISIIDQMADGEEFKALVEKLGVI